jgi:tetratricopeptide (TPR) repeat protein
MVKQRYHPLIYSYLKKYQDDPTSRVFAPLAEAYRKAGLIEEAIEIAQEGLKIHPQFVGGKVALARALFDQKSYEEVIQELSPIVQDIPDNIVAQRLLAESFLILGRIAESLSAYKMLLYFAPQDAEVAQMVQELEAQAYEEGALVLRTDLSRQEKSEAEFNIRSAESAFDGDPELKKLKKIKKIEVLQKLLQRVERYRTICELTKAQS